jgi:hypothetical protein
LSCSTLKPALDDRWKRIVGQCSRHSPSAVRKAPGTRCAVRRVQLRHTECAYYFEFFTFFASLLIFSARFCGAGGVVGARRDVGRATGLGYLGPNRNPKRKRGWRNGMPSLTLRVTIAHSGTTLPGCVNNLGSWADGKVWPGGHGLLGCVRRSGMSKNERRQVRLASRATVRTSSIAESRGSCKERFGHLRT